MNPQKGSKLMYICNPVRGVKAGVEGPAILGETTAEQALLSVHGFCGPLEMVNIRKMAGSPSRWPLRRCPRGGSHENKKIKRASQSMPKKV
jgi:hypothetical protein